jgi:hypothetical protein
MDRKALGTMAAAVMAVAMAGCDPAGPGASGQVAAGAMLDTAPFKRLVIAVFPDPANKLDLDALPATRLTSVDSFPTQLPHRYYLSEAVGTTDTKDWRVVAWLAKRSDGELTGVEPGDAFCTARFAIEGCGLFFGGYCGVTENINCTIDQVAP